MTTTLDEEGRPQRLSHYPAYTDSGVEWLGEMPAHWKVEKWRYSCHVTEGQVAPDDHRYSDRIMIAPNHVESGTGRILYTETAREQGAISGKYLVRPGDLIYSKIRPVLNKACIAEGDWLCSADMYPVSVNAEDLRVRYLLYFVLSEPFVRLMVDESMRVAMPKVNRDKLAACPLPIPPLSEQGAIVAFLDRETTTIGALVAKRERLVELLYEKRTALIVRAVTRGLDPAITMWYSGISWLGNVPAHWYVRRLKNCVEDFKSGGTPESDRDDYWSADETGTPWVSIGDMTRAFRVFGTERRVTNRGLASKRLPILPAGTLLYSMYASLGKVAVLEVDAVVNQAILGLVTRDDVVSRDFLRWWLEFMQSRVQMLSSSNTQDNLNAETVRNMPVCVPDSGEQRRIAVFLDRETDKLDALVARVREAIDRLKERRTALISAAVTGKIDVRERAAA